MAACTTSRISCASARSGALAGSAVTSCSRRYLFPRQLALDVGALDVRNQRTMDYELWGKFLLAGATFQYTHIPFARFRIHGQQKTGQGWATTQSLIHTAVKLVARADRMPEQVRQSLVADLRAYEHEYWLETGPLARLRLPQGVVLPLRDIHARLRRRAADFVRRASCELS